MSINFVEDAYDHVVKQKCSYVGFEKSTEKVNRNIGFYFFSELDFDFRKKIKISLRAAVPSPSLKSVAKSRVGFSGSGFRVYSGGGQKESQLQRMSTRGL